MNKQITEITRQFAPNWMRVSARGIRTHFRHWKSKRYVEKILETESNLRLEIGAEKKRSGWYTLDRNPFCDICWDLMKGLPFPDNSIQQIYSSHLLEHFSYPDLIRLLEECLRVLVPNGTFSVCVPNAKIYIVAYAHNEDLDPNQFFAYETAFYGNSKIDYINYTAYMDGRHKYMFDEENLLAILKKVGFSNSQLRDFDPDLDLAERSFESIYAIAKK